MASPTSYPGVPLGTMMFEISPSPVRAVIVTSPVISVPALVMNCFAPLITQSPFSAPARVRVLPASEPASGSVRPKAARRSPEHRRGSHSRFCSSEPNATIGQVPSEVWAATVMPTLESTRASSSIASA